MTERQTFADLKEQDLAAKRSLIIEAAERVFAVKPFHKVNIRDVAAEAGISHATIYRYFPDQQTLFLEAFMRGCDQVLDRIDAALAPPEAEDPLEAAAAFIAFLTENDHYFRMMTHFMLDGDLAPPLLEKLNNAQRALLDRIEAVFVARQVPEAPRPLAHAFFAALNGVLISFRDYPGRDQAPVHAHMQMLGRLIARRFSY